MQPLSPAVSLGNEPYRAIASKLKGGMAKVYTGKTGKEDLEACSPWKILLIRHSEIAYEATFKP